MCSVTISEVMLHVLVSTKIFAKIYHYPYEDTSESQRAYSDPLTQQS